MAKTLRTEGEGEQLLANINRDLFAMALRQISPGSARRRDRRVLEGVRRRRPQAGAPRPVPLRGLLQARAPTTAGSAALGVPTLIVWGAKDEFAPVGGAHRFHKQMPGARLVVLDEAGHYVMEDDPERVGKEMRSFLESL